MYVVTVTHHNAVASRVNKMYNLVGIFVVCSCSSGSLSVELHLRFQELRRVLLSQSMFS